MAANQKRRIGKMRTMFEGRSTSSDWRMMGHFAKDCRRKGKGNGKEKGGGDGSKGYGKGLSKTMKGAEKKGSGKIGGHKGGPSGEWNT